MVAGDATGGADRSRRRRDGLRRVAVAGEQLDDLLANVVQIASQLHQHLRGDTLALADQPEQDVLGPDVVVPELQRLAQGELEHLLGPRRERDVTGRQCSPRPITASTWLRTVSSEMSNDVSARAATPSPSLTRPSRRCSVPM